MRSRSFIAVALGLVILLGGAGAVLAYDASQKHSIANGITIGGVDVGGMSTQKATATLRAAYASRLSRPVVIRYHDRRFVLTPRAVHLRVDIAGSVQQALDRSRQDNLFVRTFRSLTGGRIHANLDPDLRYSEPAVLRLVSHVSHAVRVAPHDAAISYSGASIGSVDSQTGIAVREQPLTDAINRALTDPSAPRHLSVPVTRTPAKVTTVRARRALSRRSSPSIARATGCGCGSTSGSSRRTRSPLAWPDSRRPPGSTTSRTCR